MNSVLGTVVVVGCSRGIGRCIVEQFLALNYRVLALTRDGSKLDTFKQHPNFQFHFLDLETNNVRAQVELMLKDESAVDILINNAATLIMKPFLELSSEDLQRGYKVNVLGLIEVVQAAVPKMLNNERGGHIVNIGSIGGCQGSVKFPQLIAYSTPKAALGGFTELFAEEYKDTKVRMNCLCLGAVNTEMLAEAFPGYVAPLSAAEMAEFIVDFARKGNKFFNGKILPISSSTP